MPESSLETYRLISFTGVFFVTAVAEVVWPRRTLTVSKRQRWIANLVLVVLNTVLARLVLPMMPIGMAIFTRQKGWGLFNLLPVNVWLELLASVVLLDLIIYFQHRVFHAVPLLWRLHRMHHTDLDLDVSSGNRFHPLEIIVSFVIKIAFIPLIGASVQAVLLFEILLNATSLFSHANLRLPLVVDRWLRLAMVTPDMHRVHHSVIPRETDSNFGFNLPWWDRLFHTYRPQPVKGHDDMVIGLREYRDPQRLGLLHLLVQPFM